MNKYCPQCTTDYPSEMEICPTDGTRLVTVTDRDLVGQDLDGRYTVHSKLGQGGMGVVYIAEQTMVGRKVALKVLRKDMIEDKSLISRFFNEAKAIAALKSAHTITLYDFGVTRDGLLYYTMELLEGKPLSSLISRGGAIAWPEAVDILIQCLDSLEEAHDKDILHRDIKPDNIFISDKKGAPHATVLDFGIAKLMGDNSLDKVTKTGMICGTPAYLSPEQALGNRAVPASDLYSLAIVFYEMLSGAPPFCETTPMKVLLKHLNERPEPISIANPDVVVPAKLDEFLQKALEKSPGDRFQAVAAFRDGLRKAVAAHSDKPETVQLSAIATSSSGLRAITERFDPDAGVQVSDTRETPAVDPADLGMASTLPQTPATSPGSVDAVDETVFASPGASIERALDTQRDITQRSDKRWPLLAGIGGLVVAAAIGLAVWQPWLGSSSTPTTNRDPTSPRLRRAGPEGAGSPTRPTTNRDPTSPRLRRAGPEGAGSPELEQVVDKTNDQARLEAEKRASEEQTARLKAEEEARRSAKELAAMKADQEARAKAEATARAEAQARAEAEAKEEEEAKARAVAIIKAQEEAEAKAKEEAEAKAKAKASAKAKAKARARASASASGKGEEKEELEFKDTKVKDREENKPVEKKADGKKVPVEKEDEFDFKPVEVK